jgi:hypothetical protein
MPLAVFHFSISMFEGAESFYALDSAVAVIVIFKIYFNIILFNTLKFLKRLFFVVETPFYLHSAYIYIYIYIYTANWCGDWV